ncbi:MAG: AmmeMemoRadiSam system protein B [Promethearchaeota archaeon]
MTKKMIIRRATHAGTWYPGTKTSLLEALKEYFTDIHFGPGELPTTLHKEERRILGGVSPHAGMTYSGPCAAHTYFNLFKEKIPDTVIILGTDHIGFHKIALISNGEWETPLGNLTIDHELSEAIVNSSKIIEDDKSLFIGYSEQEHNIEIQLPFIKYCSLGEEVRIVTIKIAGTRDYKVLNEIADDIAKAISSSNKDVIIVASSDMSHKQVNNKEQLEKFKKIDLDVIDAFKSLDPEKTLNRALQTSICGPQTITTMMLISKNLNATHGELLKYYASSERTGIIDGYCVGYFSGITII